MTTAQPNSSSLDETFPIEVETLDGKEYQFMVTKDTNVEDLHLMLQDSLYIPVDQQRLIFDGRQFEVGNKLSAYNVEIGCRIHLV